MAAFLGLLDGAAAAAIELQQGDTRTPVAQMEGQDLLVDERPPLRVKGLTKHRALSATHPQGEPPCEPSANAVRAQTLALPSSMLRHTPPEVYRERKGTSGRSESPRSPNRVIPAPRPHCRTLHFPNLA